MSKFEICVILGGGKSSRMGRDKTLLPFRDFPTLTHYQEQKKRNKQQGEKGKKQQEKKNKKGKMEQIGISEGEKVH